jgi:ubiquinone/menaquinone biosynthesis C-methylase UbiE
MFAPITTGLIEEAQIGVGHNVLDIGGGSGEPSLTISGIVGPTGLRVPASIRRIGCLTGDPRF